MHDVLKNVNLKMKLCHGNQTLTNTLLFKSTNCLLPKIKCIYK